MMITSVLRAQCDNYNVVVTENFTQTDGVINGEITLTFNDVGSFATNLEVEVDDDLPPYTGGASTEEGESLSYVIPYSYSCQDGTFPFEGSRVSFMADGIGSNDCDTTIMITLSSESSCSQVQCTDFELSDLVELTFDLNTETGEFSWTGTAIANPPFEYASYNYNFTVLLDENAVAGNGGAGNNPEGSTTFSPFDGSVNVGVTCVDGMLSCESCGEIPSRVNVDFTFTLGDCTFTGRAGIAIDQGQCMEQECTSISGFIFALMPATCDNPITQFAFATDPPLRVGFESVVDGPITDVTIGTSDDGVNILSSGVGQELPPGTYTFTFINPDGCRGDIVVEIPEVTDEDGNPCSVTGDIDDDRQIGNTISDLGDGRLSVLNGDGTVIAFSSSGGYYVCELIGDTWTPIGGEIITETSVTEIFISADGNSIFVNLSEGFTSQCSYREGNSFTSNTLNISDREGSRVSRIFDVTGSGQYILYQTVFSEDGDEVLGVDCGNLTQGGMISTQANVSAITSISSGSIVNGFVSENGQFFCVVNGDNDRTALYTVQGQEVGTIDGQVTTAAGDLTSCLVITNIPDQIGMITVWDGVETFTSTDPFPIGEITDYDINGDGSVCVSRTIEGVVDIVTIVEDGGVVMLEGEEFVVEGLPNIRNVSVSSGSNRIIVPDGGVGEDPNLFVFEFSTMMLMDSTDTDMDGIVDRDDDDDDNDGILDSQECRTGFDYSETDFGPSEIIILTDLGQVLNVSVGSMVTDDALFDIGFPNSFNLDRGNENVNRFVIDFPFAVKDLRITAIDFDSDSFGDPTEWMDNFSVFPTEVIGEEVQIFESGEGFGEGEERVIFNGQGISQRITNGFMELIWEDLPDGTTSISWNNNRTTMDLDINFQIDQICFDTDMDGISDPEDPDSDGDGCFDVTEAGHDDPDNDGILGSTPVEVDESGIVLNQGGYTGISDAVLVFDENCPMAEECDELIVNLDTTPASCEDATTTIIFNIEPALEGDFLAGLEAFSVDGPAQPQLMATADDAGLLTFLVSEVLEPGLYTFTFINPDGCTGSATFEVLAPMNADGSPCESEEACIVFEIFQPTCEIPETNVAAVNLDEELITGSILDENGDEVDFEILDSGVGFSPVLQADLAPGMYTAIISSEELGCSSEIAFEVFEPVDENGNPCESSEACDCGNDTTAPVFADFEVGIVADCGNLTLEELGISATDNCSDVTITFEDFFFSPGCLGTLQRTYTATDMCGNSSTAVQIIDLTNESGPMIECPADETYECPSEVPEPVEPMVSHGCSNIEIASIQLTETQETEGCITTILRTWTAEDECGGISMCTQTITVVDTEAPITPVAPAGATVQCADEVGEAQALSATDNCDGTIVGVLEENIVDGDCPNSFTVTRIWTFTDVCGNVSSVSQIIIVNDTDAPLVPEAPESINVQCTDDVPAAVVLTATDECDGAIDAAPSAEILPGSCPNSFTLTRTWTFIDACGNTSSVSQVITVNDTEAPVITNPPMDITIECGEEVPAYVPVWTDNCGSFTETAVSSVAQDECTEIQTSSFTATDECGNSTTVVRVVTIIDSQAPVPPAAPEPLTVLCADDVPGPTVLTAADVCSGTIQGVSTDEVEPGACPNSFTVTRTWTFADVCGNASSVNQIITVEDTEAPMISNPPMDVTIECGDELPTFTPIWTDNCGAFTETATSSVSGDQCTEIQSFSFMAVDECGNTATVVWNITIIDTEAPVPPSAPEALSVQCSDEVPSADELFAFDSCSDDFVTGEVADVVEPGDCPNNFTVTRTWTFLDVCGNMSSVSQVITVDDTETPVITNPPADITIECGEEVPTYVPIWTDNCGTFTESAQSSVAIDDCTEIQTSSFTATDECGNSTTVVRVVTIIDTQTPVPPAAPEPLAVQCESDVPEPMTLTAMDVCSGDITVAPTSETVPGDCPNSFTLTRTWTFSDVCGNTSSVSQVIIVDDTEAPVFINVPDDETVECLDDVGELATPEATDNCSSPEVNCMVVEDTDECGNGVLIVNCTATDECGNTATDSYIITIQDTTPPEIVDAPEDLVLDCDSEIPAAPDVTAVDNCDDDVTVTMTEQVVENAGNECRLLQPAAPVCHEDEIWSMVFFDLPTVEFFSNLESTLVEFPDGTARLSGIVTDNLNPNGGFEFDVRLINGMNYEQWANQSFATGDKDECETGGFADWTYYLIDEENATLTGFGHLEGSEFTLLHAPTNLFFAYQVGVGANNVNDSFGNGGWFIAEGTLVVNGEVFSDLSVSGDFAFDQECCQGVEIERTWVATDCSGNVSDTVTQNISFSFMESSEEGSFLSDELDGFVSTDRITDSTPQMTIFPNPAGSEATIKYETELGQFVQIHLIDTRGNVINEVFNGNVSAANNHIYRINTSQLPKGVYLVRIQANEQIDFQKLAVIR